MGFLTNMPVVRFSEASVSFISSWKNHATEPVKETGSEAW